MKRTLEAILLSLTIFLNSCAELPRPDIPTIQAYKPGKKEQSLLFKNYFGEHTYDLKVDVPIVGKIKVGTCKFSLEELTDDQFEQFKTILRLDLDAPFQKQYGGSTPLNIESILEFYRNRFIPNSSKSETTANRDGEWANITTEDIYDLRNNSLERETTTGDMSRKSKLFITKVTYDSLSHLLNIINQTKDYFIKEDIQHTYVNLGNIRSEKTTINGTEEKSEFMLAYYDSKNDSITMMFPRGTLMQTKNVNIRFFYAKIKDSSKYAIDISRIELMLGSNILYLEMTSHIPTKEPNQSSTQ